MYAANENAAYGPVYSIYIYSIYIYSSDIFPNQVFVNFENIHFSSLSLVPLFTLSMEDWDLSMIIQCNVHIQPLLIFSSFFPQYFNTCSLPLACQIANRTIKTRLPNLVYVKAPCYFNFRGYAKYNLWSFNPFTPESDQCQNSPAASQEIWHHIVWRTWLFIAYSDEKWLYYKFSLHHSYNRFLKGWENTLFELRSERVNPFTPKSDHCQIFPAASPEILHHTVQYEEPLNHVPLGNFEIWAPWMAENVLEILQSLCFLYLKAWPSPDFQRFKSLDPPPLPQNFIDDPSPLKPQPTPPPQ